ncbi:MAG: NAD(+)/NADH kinase [Coriobacteriia bacterium]|nr:NAD(+)/NADH kinase [Coriobacteriia bacterium]
MRVLIVPNIDNAAAVDAAHAIAAALPAAGYEVALADDDAVAVGLDAFAVLPAALGRPDLVVALGGDGTILKAVHLLAGGDAPILGINLGRLGFLCGARDGDPVAAVLSALSGEASEERRSTLSARVAMGGRDAGTHDALNEVFVGRGPGGRAVDIAVSVDGAELSRFVGDGVLVASPTGSTAYALSAGGPLVDPALRGLVVVPVSPHTMRARPVVLGEHARVEITFRDPSRSDACVVVDGDLVPCRRSLDRVEITLGGSDVRLLRLDGRAFVSAVRDTFL